MMASIAAISATGAFLGGLWAWSKVHHHTIRLRRESRTRLERHMARIASHPATTKDILADVVPMAKMFDDRVSALLLTGVLRKKISEGKDGTGPASHSSPGRVGVPEDLQFDLLAAHYYHIMHLTTLHPVTGLFQRYLLGILAQPDRAGQVEKAAHALASKAPPAAAV